MNPANLEMIAEMVARFFGRSKNPVVFFDGVEYLTATVGFIPTLKFLRDIIESTVICRAIFIMPINQRAIEKKELALIERDMREIEP